MKAKTGMWFMIGGLGVMAIVDTTTGKGIYPWLLGVSIILAVGFGWYAKEAEIQQRKNGTK